MNYIILDLEWNQSSPGMINNTSLEFEIIEFGAVKVSEQGEILDDFHSYVYPKIFYKMHYKAKEVTGISIKELKKQGKPFYDVAKDFFNWCGKDITYVTWGEMDLTELQKNVEFYGYPKIFPKPFLYIDLQKLYSFQYGDGKKRLNLKAAVEEQQIPVNEEFHSAIADAHYTAKILQKIDMETYGSYYSVNYHRLPQKPEEELHLTFRTYSKYVSREFPTKEDALKDKEVCTTNCYLCGKPRMKKLHWFSVNGHSFYAVASCPNHGLIKSKIRLKKGHRGGVFVVKTEKFTTEEKLLQLKEKQKEVNKKKQEKKKAQKEWMAQHKKKPSTKKS